MITNIGFSIGLDRCLALYVFEKPVKGRHLTKRLGEFSQTLGHYWRMDEYLQSTVGWTTARMIHRCCTTDQIALAMTQTLRHAATAARTLEGGEQAIEECWTRSEPVEAPLTPRY